MCYAESGEVLTGSVGRMVSDEGDKDAQVEGLISDVRRRMHAIANEQPANLLKLRSVSEQMHRAVSEEVLHAIRGSIASGKIMSHLSTYEAKSEFAGWLNYELRQAGLAIKCPKTGKPTFLEAVREPVPERGRFRFDHMTDRGVHRQTLSCIELPPLDFVVDSGVGPSGRRRTSGRSR